MQNVLIIGAKLAAAVVLFITLVGFAPAFEQVVSHLATCLSSPAQAADRLNR